MKIKLTATLGVAISTLSLCLPNSVSAEGVSIDSTWRDARNGAIARVINPENHLCGPTVFDYWFETKVYEMGVLDFYALVFTGALDASAFHSLLFDEDASDDTMGVDGEYTQLLKMRHKDNQRFWDVPTDDILLLGMHGTVLADDAKMVPSFIAVAEYFDGVVLSEAEAQELIDLAQVVIEGGTEVDLGPLLGPILGLPNPFPYTPQGIPDGYNHPFLTLNAFASWADGEPDDSPFAGLPDKIVMGDGILDAYVDMGQLLGDPGLVLDVADFIHAHEFGHHVAVELGAYDGYNDLPEEDLPEATRALELMADGFGAYYCAHARGGAFQERRFEDVLNAAYSLGDCYFEFPDHHGTPNQREAAAQWGGDLASSAQNQGQIKLAWEVLFFFEEALPDLVAPDAP